MADQSVVLSREQLKHEIHEILSTADLTSTSVRVVRNQIEKKFQCDLLERKKEIAVIVDEFVSANQKSASEESSADDSDEDVGAVKKPKKSRSSNDDDDDSCSDAEPPAKRSNGRSGQKSKAEPKRKAATGKKGKGSSFTRPLRLSAELSQVMDGLTEAPRHEVVRKVWSIIKEQNLYDPKNKQFAICNDQLFQVIGVKRFRTFGMLKYLKKHFLVD